MVNLKSIICIFSLLIISVFSQISDNKNRTLNYYLNSLIFSIEEKENYFDIVIQPQIYCIRAPCIPPVINTISVKNEEDCKTLKSLFNEIINETNAMGRPISDDDLTKEQIDKIFKVFENNNVSQALKYKIIKNLGYYESKYSKRGFYTEANGLNYTIASGQRSSGGYTIEINNKALLEEKFKNLIELKRISDLKTSEVELLYGTSGYLYSLLFLKKYLLEIGRAHV